MANTSPGDVIEIMKEWTLLEISEFNKLFEAEFDVTAAAPMAVAVAPAGGAEGAEAEEEQDEFDVVLAEVGDGKINVIKAVRALTSLGLKEAKAVVDEAPGPVLESVDKETADKAKEELEAAGATVELK